MDDSFAGLHLRGAQPVGVACFGRSGVSIVHCGWGEACQWSVGNYCPSSERGCLLAGCTCELPRAQTGGFAGWTAGYCCELRSFWTWNIACLKQADLASTDREWKRTTVSQRRLRPVLLCPLHFVFCTLSHSSA